METFTGKLEGDTIIASDLVSSGLLVGTMTVTSGAQVVITGTVTGNVIAEPGSRVVISGTVAGHLDNRGGDVEVAGTVSKGLIGPYHSRVLPGAVVNRWIRVSSQS